MIIGLVGFKQVGKSTAAKYLEEKYGFRRVNMKDALVAELKKNFPNTLQAIYDATGETCISKEQMEDWLFEVKPPIIRALMQNYGTELRRNEDPHYWTTQWRLKCAEIYRASKSVVADDIRFLNEAEAVKLQGGILVRLIRPDITSGGSHLSETEQLQIVADHTIECEAGNTEKLYQALDEILSRGPDRPLNTERD